MGTRMATPTAARTARGTELTPSPWLGQARKTHRAPRTPRQAMSGRPACSKEKRAWGLPARQTHSPAPSLRRGFERRGEGWGEGRVASVSTHVDPPTLFSPRWPKQERAESANLSFAKGFPAPLDRSTQAKTLFTSRRSHNPQFSPRCPASRSVPHHTQVLTTPRPSHESLHHPTTNAPPTHPALPLGLPLQPSPPSR